MASEVNLLTRIGDWRVDGINSSELSLKIYQQGSASKEVKGRGKYPAKRTLGYHFHNQNSFCLVMSSSLRHFVALVEGEVSRRIMSVNETSEEEGRFWDLN